MFLLVRGNDYSVRPKTSSVVGFCLRRLPAVMDLRVDADRCIWGVKGWVLAAAPLRPPCLPLWCVGSQGWGVGSQGWGVGSDLAAETTSEPWPWALVFSDVLSRYVACWRRTCGLLTKISQYSSATIQSILQLFTTWKVRFRNRFIF